MSNLPPESSTAFLTAAGSIGLTKVRLRSAILEFQTCEWINDGDVDVFLGQNLGSLECIVKGDTATENGDRVTLFDEIGFANFETVVVLVDWKFPDLSAFYRFLPWVVAGREVRMKQTPSVLAAYSTARSQLTASDG